MFSQIAMFSTAETGSIGSGSDRDDHVSRRRAVGHACCLEVCKTSRFSAKRTACHFLHCAKSNIKSTRDSVLRPRFKALPEKILAELSGNTSRTRLFAQNGGEKALNRCEVPALQRKDLERTAKEQPCSLQTVGYGWVRICGVCGGKGLLGMVIKERLCKRNAFGL